jgi:hypothetical protein
MSFINWGHESPEQLAIRQKLEAEMQALFEQAARSRSGQSPFGGAGGSKKTNEQVPPVIILNLRLTFDDISNVQGVIGDPSDVSAWNTYFELPDYGNEFTSVTVEGNVVQLSGGSNITLKESLFDQGDQLGTYLLEVDDQLGCIVELEYNVFGTDDYGDGCPNLTSVRLPSATTIGDNAFQDCTSLTTIDLPSAISIGTTNRSSSSAFRKCTSLTTIDLPSATTIGGGAFNQCTSLTTIDLPSATTIGDNAFQDCTSLTTIDLPVCTNLGDTTGDDIVFFDILGNTITLTVPISLMTADSGNPDGDIVFLQDNNTVTVVTV